MKTTPKQHNDFLAHRPIPGLAFEHNDAVEVIAGRHIGDSGNIISVEALGGDPTYLVELKSGKDAHIKQSLLRPIAV